MKLEGVLKIYSQNKIVRRGSKTYFGVIEDWFNDKVYDGIIHYWRHQDFKKYKLRGTVTHELTHFLLRFFCGDKYKAHGTKFHRIWKFLKKEFE